MSSRRFSAADSAAKRDYGQSVLQWRVIITVRFFAILKERVGAASMTLNLPGEASISVAKSEILKQYPDIAELMPRVALALNRDYVKSDERLQDGDELALIPPVSGG